MRKLTIILICLFLSGCGQRFGKTISSNMVITNRDDLISYYEYDNVVEYFYKKTLNGEQDEIIEERTSNSRTFKTNNKNRKILELNIDQKYYKDGNDWYEIKIATTSKEIFDDFIKISFIDKLLGISEIQASEFNSQISSSDNDAGELVSTNGCDTTDNAIEFDGGSKQHDYGGLRYENVTIPKNSTINSAYIQVYETASVSDDPNMDIYGNDVDSSSIFSGLNCVSTLTKTTAMVNWDQSSIGLWANSPDLKDIVAEITSRDGWSSGNALSFIIDRVADDSNLNWYQYDYSDNSYGTKLVIDYTASEVSDSCTYGGGDWNILYSDNCNITSDVYVNGDCNFIYDGAGSFEVFNNATISCDNINAGAGVILELCSGCTLN